MPTVIDSLQSLLSSGAFLQASTQRTLELRRSDLAQSGDPNALSCLVHHRGGMKEQVKRLLQVVPSPQPDLLNIF